MPTSSAVIHSARLRILEQRRRSRPPYSAIDAAVWPDG